nr:hypothetical protein [Mycolicibacterium mucogenicum]
MHTGITAHPVALTADNLHLHEGATFVFLTAADADARPGIMRWLRDRGVPFIDVGVSFREGDGGLTGMAKVTAYLPGDAIMLPTTPALPPGEDDYNSNIQIAELNALNATLAVIRWKRYLGFYATHTLSNQSVYKLFLNADGARSSLYLDRWTHLPLQLWSRGRHQTVPDPIPHHLRWRSVSEPVDRGHGTAVQHSLLHHSGACGLAREARHHSGCAGPCCRSTCPRSAPGAGTRTATPLVGAHLAAPARLAAPAPGAARCDRSD